MTHPEEILQLVPASLSKTESLELPLKSYRAGALCTFLTKKAVQKFCCQLKILFSLQKEFFFHMFLFLFKWKQNYILNTSSRTHLKYLFFFAFSLPLCLSSKEHTHTRQYIICTHSMNWKIILKVNWSVSSVVGSLLRNAHPVVCSSSHP